MQILFGAAVSGGRLAALDTFDLVFQAGWVVQLVLVLLLFLSVVSWAIILFKGRELRRAAQDSEAFLEVYHEGSFDAAYDAARDLDRSPLAATYLAAYGEMNRIQRFAGEVGLDDGHFRLLDRQIRWTAAGEGNRLERGLSFLATTGSAAPFIGLFGTVIGIINAFHSIGQSGSASLAVVAPGIAEALIATAVGLFAAIPATVFYNHFVGQLRGVSNSSDIFASELEHDLRHRARAEEKKPSRGAGR